MALILAELEEIKKLCEHLIPGSRLVSCVQAMVRVEIRKTEHKLITVCIQFPENYPTCILLMELKSKTLSENLLCKLTEVCDRELKKYKGKPQIMRILQFISQFLEDHPLCVCYDEIANLKSQLTDKDSLRLKQKTRNIIFKIGEGYNLKAIITVPDNYPNEAVLLEVESNFPPAIERYLIGQAREKARRCVEAPIIKKKEFKISPSLTPVTKLLVECARDLPGQVCQGCRNLGLAKNPKDAEINESADLHVERLYCNHLFHLKCLMEFMKTPPFNGKKCPECGQRVYHEKWRVGDRLAEERWAHEQARQRELDEVTEFLS